MITVNSFEPKFTTFPAGEEHVDISGIGGYIDEPIAIHAELKSSQDVMRLLLLRNALDGYDATKGKPVKLFLEYIPYGRQDRLCNDGESFSLAIMAWLLNSCKFSEIVTADPHSDVTPALIDRLYIIKQHNIWRHHVKELGAMLVCPDAGAEKKILNFKKPYVMCRKVRDTKTGAIVKTEIEDFNKYKDYVIVDDICDGGRTFIEIAKTMLAKGHTGKLHLCVTHGVFSKGLDELSKYFHSIWHYKDGEILDANE